LLIKIGNSSGGPLQREGGRHVSAKTGPDHGMGLSNVQKVVDAYGGFLKTECDGAVFFLMAAFPESHADLS